MIKHEPTNTKQIQYPGGKNGMWNSTCSAGDYVAPPSNTAEEAEARVRQHGEAKAANAENLQKLQNGENTISDQVDIAITTEISNGSFNMFIEKVNRFGDETAIGVDMNYEQLWEHVHNCLDALERMGRDQKPKVQL